MTRSRPLRDCGLRIADCGFAIRRSGRFAPESAPTTGPTRAVAPARRQRLSNPQSAIRNPQFRSAFTLIELLVAVSILLILATMTFTMVNVTTKNDQVRAAARQMQSYLEGARDRAIHANESRGVRFQRDPNSTGSVTSMVFIGAPGTLSAGSFTVGADRDADMIYEDAQTISFGSPDFDELEERGLISNGQSIQIDDLFYTIVKVEYPAGSGTDVWRLTKPLIGVNTTTEVRTEAWRVDGVTRTFRLRLNPAVLPNQEPRLLPSGIVVDLGHSALPSFWMGDVPLDVSFSPRGPTTGLISSAGNVHFLLADIRDYESGRDAVNSDGQQDPNNLGQHLVVTVTTQTGKVSSHPIYYLTDAEVAVPLSPDKFRYAELGEENK